MHENRNVQMFARDIDKLYINPVSLLRVFACSVLEDENKRNSLMTSMDRYNFTRVYEKVCEFFETRCWFRSESCLILSFFSFFSFIIFNITFLIADFILSDLFFSPSNLPTREKMFDAIDIRIHFATKYEPMSIHFLRVYSISEIWGDKLETFLFCVFIVLCYFFIKNISKRLYFYYIERFLNSREKILLEFLYLYSI